MHESEHTIDASFQLRQSLEDSELRILVDKATDLLEGGCSIEDAFLDLREYFEPPFTTCDQIAAALGEASVNVALRSEGGL